MPSTQAKVVMYNFTAVTLLSSYKKLRDPAVIKSYFQIKKPPDQEAFYVTSFCGLPF